MSTFPSELRYTPDHEWLRQQNAQWRVGITQFSVDQLGDITLVDLPKEGDMVTKGQRFGTIDSVKSVSDLYAAISGNIVNVNAKLKDSPEVVSSDCYGEGWMVEIAPNERGELDDLRTAD